MEPNEVRAIVMDTFAELHGFRHQEAIRRSDGDLAGVATMMTEAEDVAQKRKQIPPAAWRRYRDEGAREKRRLQLRIANGGIVDQAPTFVASEVSGLPAIHIREEGRGDRRRRLRAQGQN